MKYSALVLIGVLLAWLLFVPSVEALTIQVDQYGTARFYQDTVLSKTDDGNDDRDDERNEREERQERDDSGDERDERKKPDRPSPIKQSAIRRMNAAAGKDLKFETKGDQVEIKIRGRQQNKNDFENVEMIESSRLRMEAPSRLNAAQLSRAEKRIEAANPSEEATKLEPRDDDRRQRFKVGFDEKLESISPEEKMEKRRQYLLRLKEERAQRKDELIEIGNTLENEKHTLEFTSRNIKARIENGAAFSYNQEDNEVSVTTPSGQTHTLNHLPDQAITRMQAAGVFDNLEFTGEVEITTDATDEVYYRTTALKKARLLGLFSRDIEKKYLLNDETGEVSEVGLKVGLVDSLLNAISF